MAAFGSSVGTICADYFGDELGLPLPLVTAKKMKNENKNEPVAKPVQVQHSTVTDVKKKNLNNSAGTASAPVVKFGEQALGFTPAFDGFQAFETLVYN